MIKFLGHIINSEPDQYFDRHYETTFAPEEYGASGLMTGPNKPNYETFLEQKSFLKNTYILMHSNNPEKFYEIIKNNINNQENISIYEKHLEDNHKLKLGVKKCFLRELKSYIELGFDVSYYINMCVINDFSIALLKDFLQRKKINDDNFKDRIETKEQSNTTDILSKKRKIYQNNRR